MWFPGAAGAWLKQASAYSSTPPTQHHFIPYSSLPQAPPPDCNLLYSSVAQSRASPSRRAALSITLTATYSFGMNARAAQPPPQLLTLTWRPHGRFEPIVIDESQKTDYLRSPMLGLPYEILEACLLHLPAQDLLLCQRVCRRFQDLVTSSKPIRRALFLEPAHHNGNLDDWILLKFNPFLTNQLAGSFNTRVIGVHRGKEGVKMVAHMRYEKEALLEDDWADILLREEASWRSMLVRAVSDVNQLICLCLHVVRSLR